MLLYDTGAFILSSNRSKFCRTVAVLGCSGPKDASRISRALRIKGSASVYKARFGLFDKVVEVETSLPVVP